MIPRATILNLTWFLLDLLNTFVWMTLCRRFLGVMFSCGHSRLLFSCGLVVGSSDFSDPNPELHHHCGGCETHRLRQKPLSRRVDHAYSSHCMLILIAFLPVAESNRVWVNGKGIVRALFAEETITSSSAPLQVPAVCRICCTVSRCVAIVPLTLHHQPILNPSQLFELLGFHRSRLDSSAVQTSFDTSSLLAVRPPDALGLLAPRLG